MVLGEIRAIAAEVARHFSLFLSIVTNKAVEAAPPKM
jgi:hypothetical protein